MVTRVSNFFFQNKTMINTTKKMHINVFNIKYLPVKINTTMLI